MPSGTHALIFYESKARSLAAFLSTICAGFGRPRVFSPVFRISVECIVVKSFERVRNKNSYPLSH